MRLKSIEIKNFKSHKDSKFEFGKLNEIHGPNGAGKTSITEAINLCFYGKGKDLDKIRLGESEAIIITTWTKPPKINELIVKAVLSKDEDGKGSVKFSIRSDGDKKNITWLKGLLGLKTLDLREWSAKEGREERILSAIPIRILPEEIQKFLPDGAEVDCTPHGMKVIQRVTQLMKDERRILYRTEKLKEKAFMDFEATYTEDKEEYEKVHGTLKPVNLQAIHNEIAKIDADNSTFLKRKEDAETMLNVAKNRYNKVLNEGQQEQSEAREIQNQLIQLQERLKNKNERIISINEDLKKEQTQIDFHQGVVDGINASPENQDAQKAKLEKDLAVATLADSILKKRDALQRLTQEFGEAKDALTKQDHKIHVDLKNYVASLMQPISEMLPGLSLGDGGWTYQGRNVDELSESEMHLLGLEIAKIKSPDEMMFLDGAESIDKDNLKNINWDELQIILLSVGEPRTDDRFKKIELKKEGR